VSGSVGCGAGPVGPAPANGFSSRVGDAGCDQRFAVGGGAYGLAQQGRAGVLEQETACAGAQCGVDVLVEVETW
jgi:hypothetical protein